VLLTPDQTRMVTNMSINVGEGSAAVEECMSCHRWEWTNTLCVGRPVSLPSVGGGGGDSRRRGRRVEQKLRERAGEDSPFGPNFVSTVEISAMMPWFVLQVFRCLVVVVVSSLLVVQSGASLVERRRRRTTNVRVVRVVFVLGEVKR
jgi:hypothetical protein